MRTVNWDDGTRYDDVNFYWGDPSYVLEPGDPGYVDPSPPVSPTQPKKHHRSMSSNPTPQNLKVLRALAHDMADGLHHIEVTIGMKQNKEADVRASLLPLEGNPAATVGSAAFKGSILVYQEARTATGVAEKAVSMLSDGPVYDFLLDASNLLSGILGERWSHAWLPTGFPSPSTGVPRDQGKRFALLLSLKNYFMANPTHEMNQPPHPEVTAAKAALLHTQFSDARDLAHLRAGQQEAAKNVRDADQDALFARMSGALAELRQLLPDDSPHWETLGLNIPAHPNPPEGVTLVTLSLAGNDRALAEWNRSRRSERFKVLIQVVGVDADFRDYDDTKALEMTLKDLPAGATVRVKVIAANGGGDGPESPVAQIVMPV